MSAFSSGDTTTQTSAARLGLKERQLELTKFLMGDDPLGMVLRAHMHIEEELIKFIAARDHPEKDIPRGYARCVELALNLGLREEFRKQLSALGRLRNRFAHRLDATIEKEDAETFDAAHEPGDNVIEYAYQSALTKLDGVVAKPPISDLDPKERVILHIITLWAGVAVAVAQARDATGDASSG
jgi:hypothetical protein